MILKLIFDKLGKFGPVILIFLSIYFLWNNHVILFIIGIVFNLLFNLLLKGIIQQPRPLDNDLLNIPYNNYGMPSGHAEISFFCTSFVYFCLRNLNILYLYLFISLLSITQRVVFKFHTILQIIVGSLIGFSLGYIIYDLNNIIFQYTKIFQI